MLDPISRPAFRHLDGAGSESGQVWVLWAVADQGDAQVEVPVARDRVTLVQVDGSKTEHHPSGHGLTVNLRVTVKCAARDRSRSANRRGLRSYEIIKLECERFINIIRYKRGGPVFVRERIVLRPKSQGHLLLLITACNSLNDGGVAMDPIRLRAATGGAKGNWVTSLYSEDDR